MNQSNQSNQINQINQLNTNLSIKQIGIKARINNEITHLFNQCQKVSAEHDNNTVLLKIKNNNKTYEMKLPPDYPFKSPINIYYNKINLKESLFKCPPRVKNILKRNYNLRCLCCDTIFCETNWIPTMNICYLINEIDKIIQIKKEIKIRISCDMIRDNFNCCFAEFEKYLF